MGSGIGKRGDKPALPGPFRARQEHLSGAVTCSRGREAGAEDRHQLGLTSGPPCSQCILPSAGLTRIVADHSGGSNIPGTGGWDARRCRPATQKGNREQLLATRKNTT